jgi:phosphoribosylanthranilate isomerase
MLGPHNAADAITRVSPAGFDVCSGLRRQGSLDAGLANAFVQAARSGA